MTLGNRRPLSFFWGLLSPSSPALSNSPQHAATSCCVKHTESAERMNKISVTVAEATELSHLSRSSLYNLFKSGEIKTKKAGKRTLIMVADLQRYIENLPVAA